MRNDFCKLKLRGQKGKTSTEKLEDRTKENFQEFSRQKKKGRKHRNIKGPVQQI